MKKCVLWVSAGLPFQKELQSLADEIEVNFFTGASEVSCQQDKLHAFFLDLTLLKNDPGLLRKISPRPGSLLVWLNSKAAHYLIPKKQDIYVFQEITSFEKTAVSRILKNLYRGLWLAHKLEDTRAELKSQEIENRELLQVGIALSAEQDNDKLLQLILTLTRKVTSADAGSLYRVIVDEKSGKKQLLFKIAQNDSNPSNYTEFIMPLNKKSISGWVASTGEILNIRDVYKIPAEKEYSFHSQVDVDTCYLTRSMLTVPMVDHKDEIIGVIQLINRKKQVEARLKAPEDFKKYVIPFTAKNEQIVKCLASQAAVSLENNLLYQEIETLFEGFVMASVKAIEQRDPTTSGHSSRVAEYTVALAKTVDRIDAGKYKKTRFTAAQLKEIRYASLLHDFGKVGVREEVLVKSKKLYPGQLELIISRCEFIIRSLQLELMQQKYLLQVKGGNATAEQALEKQYTEKISEIRNYLQTILQANEPAILAEEPGKVLEQIKTYTFAGLNRELHCLLNSDEYTKLKIRRGSLDEQERKEIESHVTHTYQFLSTIPWTKEMKDIPIIAYGHHEKLNGEGYPRQITAQKIPLQSKIMAIADIYDALTARDRPYKKAVPVEKALEILQFEVKDNHIDKDLVDIFIDARIFAMKEDLMTTARQPHGG